MNPEYGLSQSEHDELISVIMAHSSIDEAILFGSRAKGTHKPGSDVDIAIKGPKLSHSDVVDLSYALNEVSLLPYRFDIINYAAIDNDALREHIDRVGKLLFSRKT